MRHLAWLLVLFGPTVIGCNGCNRNPYLAQPSPAWQQQQQQQQQQPETTSVAQWHELEHRVSQLDANNRDLHTQLAQSQQQVQLLREQLTLLQKRLRDTASQLRNPRAAENGGQGLQAPARPRAGATLTANNSLQQSLQALDVPGAEARQDGDVIRIELAADQLFGPGGVQLQPGAGQLLDQVAGVLARHYPKQIVGIEGHTDNAPAGAGGPTSHHQLSAFQSLAVFQHLTGRNLLPARQLFTVAQGANHPRVSNGTPAGQAKNRRIELVIYPERYDQ